MGFPMYLAARGWLLGDPPQPLTGSRGRPGLGPGTRGGGGLLEQTQAGQTV